MKVLVACEFSGIVRDAFASKGHDAWSCDLLPTERPGQHYQCSILDVLANELEWDLMVAHPPCTYLAVSGARWFESRYRQQEDALDFVRALLSAKIPRIALENPVSVISTKIRKPDQIIQPYYFGEPFKKTTCLWLKGLPLLKPTNNLGGGKQACWKEPPHPDRWKRRSRTYQGIANAMADQWGSLQSQGVSGE